MKRLEGLKRLPVEHLLGRFCDEVHYDTLVNEDAEGFGPNGIVFKLCKAALSDREQRQAYAALRPAVKKTNSRGHAAGPIRDQLDGRDWVTSGEMDILLGLLEGTAPTFEQPRHETQAPVWLRSKVLSEHPVYENWFSSWYQQVQDLPSTEQKKAAAYVLSYISKTTYSMPVDSGTAGYIDREARTPFGRATSYTATHADKFAQCFPFLRRVNAIYKKELPEGWQGQRAAADRIDPRFLNAGTVFTTLSVNHNWRTASHRDDGNLDVGFSCLAALTGPDGKGWKGGEFILPEYRLALKLEPGDLLLAPSHDVLHANAPLLGDSSRNDRLTVVAYFRKGMLELGSWEYELARMRFCKEQGRLWKGMWRSQQWTDYLTARNMSDEDGLV
jgi:hypothetical protein